METIRQIADIYRSNNCDAFIAIGGGSAIDTAKGVNMAVTMESDDLAKFAGAGVLDKPMKPFVVIPTTAGTGSEVILVAVISDTTRDLKMAFTSPYLLPDIAILDPRMTLTLPSAMTAATGIREGISRVDDTLPGRMLNQGRHSDPKRLVVPLEKMLSRYYQIRRFDKDGIPEKAKLEKLGIPLS